MKKVLFDSPVLALTAEVQVHRSADAERYAALNREATAAKNAGDWDRAISLLHEAKVIQGDLYEDARLAKFLQQAGRFDEALVQIQWLLDHANTWAEQRLAHQPRAIRRRQQASYIARIHREAALICKRQKRSDLRQHHEAEQERWWAIHEKLAPLAEADAQQRRDEWAAASAGGPEAVAAFIKKWRPDQVS
jgi:tetratricopeptide (TPR) repeat protein